MSVKNEQWTTSDEPIYNIGVVSRMTGIPVATLRVWERRYDFPNSARTPGGHRLYSEKELLRLRWVKSTIDEGMQTSQAIRALRARERDGRIPELSPAPAEPLQRVKSESALSVFEEQLTASLIGHDLQKAEQLLGEVLALYPLEDLILDVIRPALANLGESWAEGRINVATEHLATHFLRQRLMMWMLTGPPPRSVRPIVLACAPGEWHEVSLLMLGVLLRRRRWPIAYLGQSAPLADLAKFVSSMRPPAIILVAMTEETALQLAALGEWLPQALETGRPAVTFGGRAFNQQPELRDQTPGIFLGATLPEGVETVERLLREGPAL